jgi:hypothetical protein
MLSWVGLSVVGGRLLLRVGYRTTSIAGFIVLTTGFVLLSTFQPGTARHWLYADLAVIGAGLGLTMLTLLIAVQQSVPRSELGIATSLNQFSRSIGGAIGVGVMGVILSTGLTSHLKTAAARGLLSADLAAKLSADPSALIEHQARSGLPEGALQVLQASLASAVHSVFWIGAGSAALALLVAFRLPSGAAGRPETDACDAGSGERMVMAELTTIDAEHEPRA